VASIRDFHDYTLYNYSTFGYLDSDGLTSATANTRRCRRLISQALLAVTCRLSQYTYHRELP